MYEKVNMYEKITDRGPKAASRSSRGWRVAARAGVAVAAQGTLAGALLLAGPAWASSAAPAGHHAGFYTVGSVFHGMLATP